MIQYFFLSHVTFVWNYISAVIVKCIYHRIIILSISINYFYYLHDNPFIKTKSTDGSDCFFYLITLNHDLNGLSIILCFCLTFQQANKTIFHQLAHYIFFAYSMYSIAKIKYCITLKNVFEENLYMCCKTLILFSIPPARSEVI